MARYKEYSYEQILMVPVSFEKQMSAPVLNCI
jgi:hypothetical protein